MRQIGLAATLAVLAPCGYAQPNQEVVPPTEAADTAAIVKTIEDAIAGAYASGVRPAMRDAHAKAHGCVKADFAVKPDLPAQLRVGVFAEPKTYAAWIRFSNGSGMPQNDAAGDGRGMAIKLIGVPGTKLLAEEASATTQDFVMINFPVFFNRNVADYRAFTTLQIGGNSAAFLAEHAHEAAIIEAITAMTVNDVFEQRYFSMAPYLLGDGYIKFSARPVECATGAPIAASTAPVPANEPDYLRERMVARLDDTDACFAFAVQPQTHPATQPIEDPTITWEETEAPFVDVASIRIPLQTFDSAAQQIFCENLSFTPWHALLEHRPVGGINRLRKAVYEAISTERHKLNQAPRQEPTGDETFN